MTDLLLLIYANSGAVQATLCLADDGSITAAGRAAQVARAILAGYARLLGTDDRAAFFYLRDFGWTNGPLALIPANTCPSGTASPPAQPSPRDPARFVHRPHQTAGPAQYPTATAPPRCTRRNHPRRETTLPDRPHQTEGDRP